MVSSLTLLTSACLGASLAWLARLALPAERAIKVRNAFLLRRGRSEDFAWTPERVPAGFRVERSVPPSPIVDAVRASGAMEVDGDWARALRLVGMLVAHAGRGGAVRADLATTWREIVAGNGYCADYVRVYLAAAAAAGLFCRQWGFSSSGFGGNGHTFVEVFDRARGRWAFIDVHNNVYAVAAGSDEPLDALALHAALRSGEPSIVFVRATPGRLGYEHPHKLVAYYRRGLDEWHLWWGNDVVARSEGGLAGLLGRVSGRLSHRLAGAPFTMPRLVVVPGPSNENLIRRAESLRRQVRVALSVVVAATAAFVAAWLWPAFEATHG